LALGLQEELIEAKEKAEESEKKFKLLYENAPLSYQSLDTKACLIDVNPTWLQTLGYKREEVIGRPFSDFMTSESAKLIKERFPAFVDKGEIYNYEFEMIRKDGTRFLVSYDGKIGYDELGHFNKTHCIFTEITVRKKAEIELIKAKEKAEESEEILDYFFTQSMDGFFFMMLGEPISWNDTADKQKLLEYAFKHQRVTKANDALLEQYRATKEQFIGYTPANFFKHDIAYGRKVWGELFDKGKLNIDSNEKKFDGTDMIIEGDYKCIYNTQNQIIGLFGIQREVTATRKAEKELIKLSQAIEQSPVSIIITDLKGTIEYCNPKVTQITGYEPSELIGQNPRILSSGNKTTADYSALWQTISNGNEWFGEFLNKKKNGELFWESASISPIIDVEGKMTHYLAVKEDITETKKSQTELNKAKERAEESEKQIKYSQEVAKIGYYQLDAKKGFWTSSEMLDVIFGIDKEYIRNIEGWGNLICPEFKLKMTEYFNNEILLKNSGFNKEYKIINQQTKKEIWVHGLGELNYDELGNLIQMFGTIQDITDKKTEETKLIEAKEHAEESDRLKSAFLANMSHEIRTPMNGILGFSDLLKTPNLSGEVQQQYIQIIEKSGMRMLNIINDIISISKIESGVMEANLKASNINEQIEYIDTLFKPEAEAKGITLSFNNSLSLKEAIVKTDHEKLNAILASLVKNAIKYTQSGSIELGYTKKAKQLQFYVKDTGIGIDKDRQKAIFERFIQADIFDENALQGAGLGLSISKAYVEMLGGKIWVESEIGKGSIFYFTLPYDVETKAENESITDNSDRELEMPLKKMKILIVDDDEKSSWLLGLMLKKLYKQVLYAENGLEAVEVCRNNPDIDLILMDIQMPVMNGYEATRQIREFNNEVVIITQTAFALSGDREKLLAAGCNDYISKPINKAELLALIHRYFNK